ncbi:TonB-dependent siderophore receptor [Thalassotalea sediminis]|uniref:TonB-dependent siderophore receptor n=1 Tax=Thalassotalea sediminis TaxID=1759089 RepID=UPI0025731D35|nr:TonB-dependent siderophore receptor [Thalassotalea sediminis]
MKLTKTFTFSALILAMGFPTIAQETSAERQNTSLDKDIEQILIVGVRSSRISKGATGLTMKIDETPQSISMVSAEQIKNYATTNLNDALKLATGINVEEWETNRTNYTSRGFEIKNTQIDGIGMPNDWGIVTGAMEAYGYDKIEVIRGANGLLTGVGSSAGTINYVRKRPTNENQGEVNLSVGSYDLTRIEADYSLLLTEDGRWAARAVVAAEDKGSYLKGLENDRTFFYGTIDGQLTNNSTLAFGYSYQDANTDGNMWGALVFNYTDGTQAEWKTSATTTQDWTMWDTINTTAFIEYVYMFENDWELKATYNQRTSEEDDKLFYAYGSIDKDTGLGLVGWPGRFGGEFDADLFDLTINGDFSLFGQNHELVFGASHSKSKQHLNQYSFDFSSTPAYGPTPAFPYALDAIPEPVWQDNNVYSKIDVTLKRYFGSTKLNVTEDFFVIAGFNAIDYSRHGVNNAVDIDNEESEFSPYVGATYSVTEDINLYASYSDIYQPQEQYDIDGYFLAPTKGVNFETGIKTTWFDNNLLATFAYFTAEQEGIANYAGINPATGQYFYNGIDVESKGYELEVVGRINENLTTSLAYTNLDMDNSAGGEAHEWAPRNVINFLVDYKLSAMPSLTVGLGGKWQSKTKNVEYNVKQDAYLLVNAFARWDINDRLSVQANINNITDEKYITSLHTVGYYAAPTNGSVRLSYQF